MPELPPIPDSKEDLDRYEVEHLYHSWGYQPSVSPPRVVGAKGVRFELEDGRTMLDFSSCFVSHNIGHQDPRVVQAIKDQADVLTSFAPVFSTKPRAKLAKLLTDITPGDLSRCFMTIGGTEANEAAIKIAHQYTGRQKIISRYPAYHGGTASSMTASAGDPRNWFQVLGGTGIVTVPQPYPYRCFFGTTNPTDCAMRTVEYTRRVIEMEGGDRHIAAIILEPITGANGVLVPPDEYLPALREICDDFGVLMICDEVMTGFGRTGKWFAVDHWDVVPDILTMAKGLTCGYAPLGVTITRKHIGDRFKEQFFGHGATYAGHTLGCAAALATIPIYASDNLIENSATMGEYLKEQCLVLQEKHPCIGDVRGKGLFVGLELVKNKTTKEPIMPYDAKVRREVNPKMEIAKKLGQLGMIAMAANPTNTIALAPPLIVTKDEIDEGISMVDEALKEADKYCD